MKRFIAGIMTVAMAATMTAFAFSSSAANDEVRGVIPRTKVDVTLDAKDDEDFWANAYYEELNEENAFIKETQMEEEPTTDLPSLKIKMAYYSEIAEGTDPATMRYSKDTNGGILVYMEVIDKHKAFTFGNTKYDELGNEVFDGYPSANATDCVQLAFDPLDKNGTSGGAGGSVIFSFVPYSIVAPEGKASSPGVGTIAGGRGWWWQHWGGGFGYGDNSGDLLRKAVEMKANTDYVFDPAHQLPGDDVKVPILRVNYIRQAYQYASIEGYQIEAKIHWNVFDIEGEMGIKPYEGRQFGLMISLVDYMFDDFNISSGDSAAVEAAQHVYRVYLNGSDEDEGWLSVDNPSTYATYALGGFINDDPQPAIVYGDANGDGSVDITDAMLVFYHVAKKEMMTDADQLKRCDVDKNGDVDISDAMRVFYFVAKKIDSVETDDSAS